VGLEIVLSVFAHGRGFNMVLEFKIKIDEKKAASDLNKEIQNIVYKNIPKIQNAINDKIEKIVFQRLITGVPTIQGQDVFEIGVPDINNRLASIIRVASQSIEVKVSRGKILKIDIGILRQDYSDLLSLPESVFTYTSARGSGILEWLRWLLIEGNGVIVGGFEFSPIPSAFSRTSGGVMTAGSGWSVPSNLAGSSQNNILTRALQNIEKDIETIIKQELQRIIK